MNEKPHPISVGLPSLSRPGPGDIFVDVSLIKSLAQSYSRGPAQVLPPGGVTGESCRSISDIMIALATASCLCHLRSWGVFGLGTKATNGRGCIRGADWPCPDLHLGGWVAWSVLC